MLQTSQTRSFLDFLDASPSPYHAVDWIARRLIDCGFIELSERAPWHDADKKKAFVRRGGKALIAWVPGHAPMADAGFRLIGAHADSPALKPRTNRIDVKFGLPLLETGVYGSPILPTWLDREYGLAGQIFLRNGQQGQLYSAQSIRLRTSSLAIHLDKGSRQDGLKLNPQTHLNCLLASQGWQEGLDLPDLIAAELKLQPDDVLSHDLTLYDLQPAAVLPGQPGLISAGRLDNLFSCYCAAMALSELEEPPASTAAIALFDAEEIGSRTWTGAQATPLASVLERLALSAAGGAASAMADYQRAIASSCFVSVDMAHANHPLYPDRLAEANAPDINGGVAIKKSDRGHYATSIRLEARLRQICGERDIPLQEFRYREDLGGGSSIGPLVAARLGIESIDAGAGLLGMHSVREVAGSADLAHGIAFSKAVFAI